MMFSIDEQSWHNQIFMTDNSISQNCNFQTNHCQHQKVDINLLHEFNAENNEGFNIKSDTDVNDGIDDESNPRQNLHNDSDVSLWGREDTTWVIQSAFYTFWMQIHLWKFSQLLHAEWLFQWFITDAYACVELNRLNYIKQNQKQFCAEHYSDILDWIEGDDITEADQIRWIAIICPSSVQGTFWYMKQKYEDAMTLTQWYQKPEFFITFITNSNWPEIQRNLFSGQSVLNHPDLITQIFKLKLKALLNDLIKKHLMRATLTHIYLIEFQKWELSHAHILLILHTTDRICISDDVDLTVCTEFSQVDLNSLLNLSEWRLFALICVNMIHNLCNQPHSHDSDNSISCLNHDNQCKKQFSKKLHADTQLENVDSYSLYCCHEFITFSIPDDSTINNWWIISYNSYLLLKYSAHMNIEICASVMSAYKYIFKYVFKSSDHADITVTAANDNVNDNDKQSINETVKYQNVW